MAVRPVFRPIEHHPFVIEMDISFKWYPGFSVSQTQKSIFSLHHAIKKQGVDPVLEISSKSSQSLGFQLSAFNLVFETLDGKKMSVECAFQGSKVFENGGPYRELYQVSSRKAKKDERLQTSGKLTGFLFMDEEFPTNPKTAFYDWLYLLALKQNQVLSSQLPSFQGFTDIVFNPKKSFNCQARSAALFVALSKKGLIEKVDWEKSDYLSIITGVNAQANNSEQNSQQLEFPY